MTNTNGQAEEVREVEQQIAAAYLKETYGVEWGHSGTCDDDGWRRIEKRYLAIAHKLVQPLIASEKEAARREIGEYLDAKMKHPKLWHSRKVHNFVPSETEFDIDMTKDEIETLKAGRSLSDKEAGR